MSELNNNPNHVVDQFYSENLKESFEDYDTQHPHRYPATVKHLLSYDMRSNVVCDMGCGSAFFLKQLDDSNRLIGIDGATIEIEDEIERYKYNLDYDRFADDCGITDVDHMLCFETFEHLTNPYNFIFECKKMMKDGALFHLSYPTVRVEHNTFYPSLLWPKENFVQFMEQMSFELKDIFDMPTRFGGVHFFVFENRPWKEVKMKWKKSEEDHGLEPPHVQVNM